MYEIIKKDANGNTRLKLNGKWGYMDDSAKQITEIKYDFADEFTNGFARVEINGKWGYINLEGVEICKLEYGWTDGFYDKRALVQKNGKYGFIDVEGNSIGEIKYDSADKFFNGFCAVKINNKWGWIDKNGREICEIKFLDVNDFYFGIVGVELEEEKYGYVNTEGKIITVDEALAIICEKQDEENWYFWKYLSSNLVSPIIKFQYELNKEYSFKLNEDVLETCAHGFNVATKEWCKTFMKHGDELFLCKIPKNQKVTIPFNFKGKLRCERGMILDDNNYII